ncbi:glycosyltransferase family 2 protein [Sphingomonas sp. Leaf257]|uniref:glycosyltransferase family 2 protein n=1 Tax=Sphingomonas sp. Leaf257 TaxID=1736309 RepID=UPI0009E98945|nr:glycosyltransferase family 2 protein [Sphingomonas sp. Leaf257]
MAIDPRITDPRIAVAMATYNGARYIREQLESIAAQTLPPVELVVSDDGSTDDTLAIVRAFAAQVPFPVRILDKAERLGFADNFLHAAAACTAPLVALSDQDDVWLPHKLATSHARLRDDASLLAMHRLTLTDEDLRPIGTHDQGIAGDHCFTPLEIDPYVTGWGNSMMFRRELVTLVPRADRPRQPQATRPLSHDTWLYVLAAALGRVSHIAEPLILYRQHGANVYGTTVAGGALARWKSRLDVVRTVPLTVYRERAVFDAHMTNLFAALAERSEGCDRDAAAQAATRFAERAARWARRVRLYDGITLPQRAGEYFKMLRSPTGNPEATKALRRAAAKDLLLGVAGLGRRI